MKYYVALVIYRLFEILALAGLCWFLMVATVMEYIERYNPKIEARWFRK